MKFDLVPISQTPAPDERYARQDSMVKNVWASTQRVYEKTGFQVPWTAYLAIDGKECVGTCAFKAPPQNNRVEIAYFTFPRFEGHGYATYMARQLIEIARKAQPGITVFARTVPGEGASATILTRLGFQNKGIVEDPEDGDVLEWDLSP